VSKESRNLINQSTFDNTCENITAVFIDDSLTIRKDKEMQPFVHRFDRLHNLAEQILDSHDSQVH